MNIESRSRPAEVSDERRSEARSATVFRPVLIETDQFAGFCLVRNLSALGLMGRVYTSFAEGMEIAVEFHPDKSVRGTIMWSRDGEIGVQFCEAIDVDQVLSDLARNLVAGKINRAPRLQMRCKAELAIGDRSLAIELQDVSQRGMKVSTSFVKPGDEVQVRIDGLEPRKATVRWTQPGTAGLNFHRALSFEELARWVIDQQASRWSSGETSRPAGGVK